MKMNHRLRIIAGSMLITAGSGLALLSAADAATMHPGKTLYSFTGAPDGAYPNGDLIVDDMGVFYGTTSLGGVITPDCPDGCGTVYKVENGVESVIYRFTGISDGAVPYDGLLRDAEGNLYGVTRVGGGSNMGTVFEISPDGSKTTLHSFAGGTDDGANPNGDLIADAEGNLYGTTYSGGIGDCEGGCGTVFKVTPDGEESILYAFAGVDQLDGKNPFGGLVADEEGNFYGTTYGGGGRVHCGPAGCGTLFKITPDGQMTLLHRFEGGYTSAGHPRDRLLRDMQGNFYGTTYNGGIRRFGCVWKVSPDGATETILYSFHHHKDGEGVGAGLVADSAWNLYGATLAGGENLAGIVYRVSSDGRIASLYDFPDATTSAQDVPGRMIIDRQGNLIGATNYGGASDNCSPFGCGTIFIVKN